jgi:hypothetical protein
MSYARFLEQAPTEQWFPWLGGRQLRRGVVGWKIEGPLPLEHSWCVFATKTNGRALFLRSVPEDDVFQSPEQWQPHLVDVQPGYLAGDRFVPSSRTGFNPWKFERIGTETERVHLVEPGLDRFEHIQVGRIHEHGPLVYMGRVMPLGPEGEANQVFLDGGGLAGLRAVKGVVPALELAFRMEVFQKEEAERRRLEIERQEREAEERRRLEERRAELMRTIGTAESRRELATTDFRAAAQAALRVGGAEYLDHRASARRGEMVVRYRVQQHRLECVCIARTLQIVDAGICLTSHGGDGFDAGEKGDTMLTLESIPTVVRQAIRENKLVVYRRVG